MIKIPRICIVVFVFLKWQIVQKLPLQAEENEVSQETLKFWDMIDKFNNELLYLVILLGNVKEFIKKI